MAVPRLRPRRDGAAARHATAGDGWSRLRGAGLRRPRADPGSRWRGAARTRKTSEHRGVRPDRTGYGAEIRAERSEPLPAAEPGPRLGRRQQQLPATRIQSGSARLAEPGLESRPEPEPAEPEQQPEPA